MIFMHGLVFKNDNNISIKMSSFFKFLLTALVAGTYTVSVTVGTNAQPVIGSPFTLQVLYHMFA